MKRLTRNDYNSCFDCNYYSGCSYIRKVNPLVCSERERYDRLAAIEDILGDDYELTDVTPVRHGRWKNGGNGLYDTCSACEKEIYLAIPMNYCPSAVL